MSRKRAESLKGLPLPTSNRPQSDKEMASMHNYRESGILLLSLTQSRQAWTSSILKKFSSKQDVVYHPVLPEHTNPNASVSLLGKCHITIGPHTFYDTKIYEAVYEARNPDVQCGNLQIQPNSLTGSQFQTLPQTASQPDAQMLPQSLAQPVALQTSTQTQQSSTQKTNSYSTSSRPIQPAIQPRPANQAQSQVPIQPRGTAKISARSTPSNSPTLSAVPASSMNTQNISSNVSSYVNSNLNSSSASGNTQSMNVSRVVPSSALPANSQLTALFQTITPSQILVIQEQLRQPQAAINMTPEQKTALINQLTTIHQLLTSPQQPQQTQQQLQQIHSRPQPLATRSKQIVRYELLLEFRETKSDKWLFPKEAVLEAMSMSEPYDV
ncbi:7316_t:CDS:2 [Acaulospora morrowiae]|uniref:7316_t:CDS:1 n=1 Tax=Acaulospora morrowiae TaxID=94023 RepID=A0A9N9IGQ4_9GLOM|nr:7316_t:CDS:2 [Acaulospora morrowiae]